MIVSGKMKNLKKFIVVDDDPTNNLICGFVIKKKVPGADVKVFNDPMAGLSYIKTMGDSAEYECEPTVLFLDINMPTMTGWEFLDAFRNLDPEIQERFRIYMLSSSVEDFSKESAKYPFVQDFLSKPLSNAHMNSLAQSLSKEKTG